MFRSARLLRSRRLRGLVVFVVFTLVSGYLLRDRQMPSARQDLIGIVNQEIAELRSASERGQSLGVYPRVPAGSPVRQALILQFFESRPLNEIHQNLRRYLSSQFMLPHEQRVLYEHWENQLSELVQQETRFQHSKWWRSGDDQLKQARLLISLGHGAFLAGEPDLGLIHLLVSLRLASGELHNRILKTQQEEEAAFIIGNAIYLIFGRARVLKTIRSLGSASVWSIRSGGILSGERRS